MEEIRLDLAEVKQEPPEEVKKTVKESLSEFNRYPSGDYKALKNEFADYLGVKKENVCFSNGLDEMIDIVTELWGAKNFIPTPTFSQFAEASERRDQKTIKRSMMDGREYCLDIEKVDFTSDLIWLCTPNNPTGTEVSIEKVRIICNQASGLVVVDECYAEFTGNTCINLINEFDNLVVLRSFSKSFGLAGLRLGAAISAKKRVNEIDSYRQPFNVSRIAEGAGKAVLKNQEKYESIREEILKTGRDFAQFLESRGIKTGKVNGNFVLAEFDSIEQAKKYYRGLERLNVSVFPGWDDEFSGLDGKYIRFTIGTPKQMSEVKNRVRTAESESSELNSNIEVIKNE